MAKTPNPDKFKSQFEVKIFKELRALEEAGGYKTHYEPVKFPYVLEKTYKPDFRITRQNGELFIEAKGYFRAEDREKLAAVRRSHPDLDLRIVFTRDNKIHPQSNMRYSDWCKKYDFEYAIGSVPKEWLLE